MADNMASTSHHIATYGPEELKEITGDYTDVLGRGGYGVVYKVLFLLLPVGLVNSITSVLPPFENTRPNPKSETPKYKATLVLDISPPIFLLPVVVVKM